MLQSHVTIRNTDAEKEFVVAPTQAANKFFFSAHFKTFRSEISNSRFQYDLVVRFTNDALFATAFYNER